MKNYFYVLPDKWLSGGKDVVEQFQKTLPCYFGNRLSNSQSYDVTVTNELMIGWVGQYESVLRSLKKSRKTRRPGKHLPHPMKLFGAGKVALGSAFGGHFCCCFS